MPYNTQELKWIEALIQKDIAENKAILGSDDSIDQTAAGSIIELHIANMEHLINKTQAEIARQVKRKNKSRDR